MTFLWVINNMYELYAFIMINWFSVIDKNNAHINFEMEIEFRQDQYNDDMILNILIELVSILWKSD